MPFLNKQNAIERIDTAYDIFKSNMTSESECIKSIIDVCNLSVYTEDIRYFNSVIGDIINKAIKILIDINPTSNETFKFLESLVIDNDFDVTMRQYVYALLQKHFPKQTKKIKEYLLYNDPTYFPYNSEHFGYKDIKKSELGDFLWSSYRTLNIYLREYYEPFSYDYKLKGFSNPNCLIVHKRNNPFKYKQYIKRYSFDKRGMFEKMEVRLSYGIRERLWIRGYFIENKYFVRIRLLSLAIKLFKAYNKKINTKNLFIHLPKNTDNPVRIENDNTDFLIYIYLDKIKNIANNKRNTRKKINNVNRLFVTKLGKQQKLILKSIPYKIYYHKLCNEIFKVNYPNDTMKGFSKKRVNSYRASFSRSIKGLRERGLIDVSDNIIELTDKGVMVKNEIF